MVITVLTPAIPPDFGFTAVLVSRDYSLISVSEPLENEEGAAKLMELV
jgi:hypothetical protein